MAELKFSCIQCGQHISATEEWSGHQIQCPSCAATLTVPHALPPPAAAAPIPKSLVPQPPASQGPRLSAGATQVARATTPGPAPAQQRRARPPKSQSPLLKYVVYGVVAIALAGAGYAILPGLVSKIQNGSDSKPTQGSSGSGGGGASPLGEVNGAMDVSDAMEGGSSPRPHAAPARQPAVAQAPAAPPVTPAPRSTNSAARAKIGGRRP